MTTSRPGFGFNSLSLKDVKTAAATYHKLVEAFKFGYGRRSALGDPLFQNISAVCLEIAQSNDFEYLLPFVCTYLSSFEVNTF